MMITRVVAKRGTVHLYSKHGWLGWTVAMDALEPVPESMRPAELTWNLADLKAAYEDQKRQGSLKLLKESELVELIARSQLATPTELTSEQKMLVKKQADREKAAKRKKAQRLRAAAFGEGEGAAASAEPAAAAAASTSEKKAKKART
jgi:hypothetical protein